MTVRAESGRERYFQIVGVDEADASKERVAFVSPLARAVLGKRVGDVAVVKAPRSEEELEVVAIEYEGATGDGLREVAWLVDVLAVDVGDVLRYGDYSKMGESIYDHPFQWGSKRIGPDLAREGGKYPNSWHFFHMRDPRQISPGSNRPPQAL